MLTPMLGLICWTLVILLWMYATRLPAIKQAGIDIRGPVTKEDMAALPPAVRQIADNYNHLHEQPVLFYALMIYSELAGMSDPLNVGLAWGYVGTRVVHSLIQCTVNFIPARFTVFILGTLLLMIIAVRDVIAL